VSRVIIKYKTINVKTQTQTLKSIFWRKNRL